MMTLYKSGDWEVLKSPIYDPAILEVSIILPGPVESRGSTIFTFQPFPNLSKQPFPFFCQLNQLQQVYLTQRF